MSEKPAFYGSRKIEEERRVDPMRSSPSIPLLLALLPSAASYAIGGHAACPSAARTTTPLAKAAEFFFEMAEDRSKVTFGCRQQSITMVKPEEGGSLQEFIGSNSDALVISSWDPDQVERVPDTDPPEFVIQVEEFDFVALKFAVELRARCSLDAATTTAKLDSLGFRMIGPGMAKVQEAIDVTVSGKLRPSAPDARICALSGDVMFTATGALPSVLRPAPEAAIRAAARAMSESLIKAAQERFNQRVPKAYAKWAAQRSPVS